MKPLKVPGSRSGELKPMKKKAKLCVTPITKYFQNCTTSKPPTLPLPKKTTSPPIHPSTPSSVPHPSLPKKNGLTLTKSPVLPLKFSSPHTPSSLSPVPSSPVSRSSSKKKNSLTPVKLSNNFEFDFMKIPSTPSPVKPGPEPSPPTPPASPTCLVTTPPLRTSQSFPSTPKSRGSHQSLPSSIDAPPFSPLSPPSPHNKAYIGELGSPETPLPPQRSNPRKRPFSGVSRRDGAGPSVYREVIEISSDSHESDVDVCSCEPRRLSVKRVTSKHVIVIDTSSESELESPRPKKHCSQSVKRPDSTVIHSLPKARSPTRTSSHFLSLPKKPADLNSPKGRISGTVVKLEDSKSTYVVKLEGSQSTSAVKLGAVPGGFQSEQMSEMQALLWRRGCPHLTNGASTGSTKVSLLSGAQSSIVDNHLDTSCRFLSAKLDILAQYLHVVTSPSTMVQGESMAALFLLLSDPEKTACCVHPDVRDSCVGSLRQVLLVHPPGSHRVVDTQYRRFMVALEGRGEKVWELMQTLLSGPPYCCQLLSFLVDLLLSDYWATVHNGSDSKALFLNVFWSGKDHSHVTTPIRQLVDELSGLLRDYSPSRDNELRLDSLVTLLYLCSTVCADLTTNVLGMCKSLPSTRVHLLLGRLHSRSLYSHLINSLPNVRQTLIKSEKIFTSSLKSASQSMAKKPSPVDKEPMKVSISPVPGEQGMDCSSRENHPSMCDTAEQGDTWKTVNYGEDKFPCIQVKKSPPKSKDQLPKNGCVKRPKQVDPSSNTNKPPSHTDMTSYSTSILKTTKISETKPPKSKDQLSKNGFVTHSKPITLLPNMSKPPSHTDVASSSTSILKSTKISEAKPPKSKDQSSKNGYITHSKPVTLLPSMSKPPSHTDTASSLTSIVKDSRISDTKPTSTASNKAPITTVKYKKELHKTSVDAKGKLPLRNGLPNSTVQFKGQMKSTSRGCVSQPMPSVTLSRDKPGPSRLHAHSSHSNSHVKSTKILPQPKHSVTSKSKPTPSQGPMNPVSKPPPSDRSTSLATHSANYIKSTTAPHPKPVSHKPPLSKAPTSSTTVSKPSHKPPWQSGTYSASLTRPSLKQVSHLKSTAPARPSGFYVKKESAGKSGTVTERPKSLVATGTVRRDCENCISGTCVNPSNAVHTLNV